MDATRRRLYVTTGDNYSSPATELSDAVVALDMASGRIVWSQQVTKGDAYNGGCGAGTAQCPAEKGPDFDFGSPAILTKRAGRTRRAGGGSEVRDRLRVRSRRRRPDPVADADWKGGTGGGIQWGMASDGRNIYAAVSDPGRTRQNNPLDPRRYALDPNTGGGVSALRIADGSRQWFSRTDPVRRQVRPWAAVRRSRPR